MCIYGFDFVDTILWCSLPFTNIHVSLQLICTNSYITGMYTYIHTYVHAYSYISTCVHAYRHTYIHTYIHTYVRTYVHTYNYITRMVMLYMSNYKFLIVRAKYLSLLGLNVPNSQIFILT